jgi:hypothetical protein
MTSRSQSIASTDHKHTSISSGMKKYFHELFRGEPIVQGANQVLAEFVGTVESRHHTDVREKMVSGG